MGGGGSSGGTSTTIQKSEPWEGQKPYLEDLYAKAKGAYGQMNKTPWQGPLSVGLSPEQSQSVALLKGQVPGLTNIGQPTIDLAQSQIRGDFLRPETNPYLRGTVDAAFRPVMETFSNSIVPSLQYDSIRSGAYGGEQDKDLRVQASSDLTRNLGDLSSQIYLQNYANERAIQQQAPGMLSAGVDLNQIAPTLLSQVGEITQGESARMLEDQIRRHELEQMAPWLGLNELSQLYGNVIPGGGTSSTSGRVGRTSALTGGLSGALGGAAAGTAILPGWGTAGGAILGGLAGLFGR